jgi:hypothetical protein
MDDIGLTPQTPSKSSLLATEKDWNYESFKSKYVPTPHPQGNEGFSPIYRGVVPAKNLFNRDFAINGAIVTSIVFLSAHHVHNFIIGRYARRIYLGNHLALDLFVFPRRSVPQPTANCRGCALSRGALCGLVTQALSLLEAVGKPKYQC